MFENPAAHIPAKMKENLVQYLLDNCNIIKIVPMEHKSKGRRMHHIHFDNPSPELLAFLMSAAEDDSIMYKHFVNSAMLLPIEAVKLYHSIKK